jgi:hypothetical protein
MSRFNDPSQLSVTEKLREGVSQAGPTLHDVGLQVKEAVQRYEKRQQWQRTRFGRTVVEQAIAANAE